MSMGIMIMLYCSQIIVHIQAPLESPQEKPSTPSRAYDHIPVSDVASNPR